MLILHVFATMDSTAWLHGRADWEDWTCIHSHLLRCQHLLGPHHRPTEAQDESDHHHPPPRVHGQLHLVDADVLARQPGKHPIKPNVTLSSMVLQGHHHYLVNLKVSHSIYSLSTAIILGTCCAGSCDPLFFEMTVLPPLLSFVLHRFTRWSWPILSTRARWPASSP